jgi:hypothetical protein
MKALPWKRFDVLIGALLMSLLWLSGPTQAAEVDVEEMAVAVDVVVGIDKATRTITLKNEAGKEWMLVAGPEVRNFDQLQRGDLVITEYFAGTALAIEPKGSGLKERITSFEVERAKLGDKPGMSVRKTTFVIAEVVAVDPELRVVEIQGARGSLILEVDAAVDMSGLQPGAEIEAVYVEALAITVEPAPKVSGTVELRVTSVALGVGVEWGSGTLVMYDGSTHEFKLKGLTLVDVGAAAVTAEGEVYHLVEAKDVEGSFLSAEAGASLVDGESVMTMKNDKGVIMKLRAKQSGVRLTLAGKGLSVQLK